MAAHRPIRACTAERQAQILREPLVVSALPKSFIDPALRTVVHGSLPDMAVFRSQLRVVFLDSGRRRGGRGGGAESRRRCSGERGKEDGDPGMMA